MVVPIRCANYRWVRKVWLEVVRVGIGHRFEEDETVLGEERCEWLPQRVNCSSLQKRQSWMLEGNMNLGCGEG